jgi:hypothetical protein
MKKVLFSLLFSISLLSINAQNNLIGSYEQEAFIAPDELKDSDNDLTITQDPNSTKKIWISNLVANAKIYAVLHTKGEDNVIYKIPTQTINGYVINLGCVVYDKEDQKLTVSVNNKENCYGISQSDWDKGVSVGKGGVKAGDTQVGSNGTIKTGGVDISNGNINVDTKKVMAGIQYVGTKTGIKKKTDDD